MSNNNNDVILAAAAALVQAVAAHTHGVVNPSLSPDEQTMQAAAFVAGVIEADSEVTLSLDSDTYWLQEAYEQGRFHGAN